MDYIFTKNKLLRGILFSFTVCVVANTYATVYIAPPSSSTSGHVPYISDAAMEQCVKLYNEAKWLGEEINRSYVDQYSQASVDTYNSKVSHHSLMINGFNRDCAGKQSESAYRTAQKLNQQIRN